MIYIKTFAFFIALITTLIYFHAVLKYCFTDKNEKSWDGLIMVFFWSLFYLLTKFN
jgi:hypothetical protein